MSNKMFVVFAVCIVGCAGGNDEMQKLLDGQQKELTALHQEITSLRADQNAVTKASAEAPSAKAAPQGETAPVAVHHGPPPARPAAFGPPENWGWVDQEPMGCEKGNSLALRIKNPTADKWMRAKLNGAPVEMSGALGPQPLIPPGSVLNMCLADPGVEHTIEIDTFLSREGYGFEAIQGPYGSATLRYTPSGAAGPHEIVVDDPTLFLN